MKMSVKVFDVKVGSPAYRAGIDLGDRIYEIDGARVDEPSDIAEVLRTIHPDDEVTIRVRTPNWSRKTLKVSGVGRRGLKKRTQRLGVITDPNLAGRFYRRSMLRNNG